MAKTNNIIQAKESSHMNDTVKKKSEGSADVTDVKQEEILIKKTTFKELVCPNVPSSYFKRAKRQRTK